MWNIYTAFAPKKQISWLNNLVLLARIAPFLNEDLDFPNTSDSITLIGWTSERLRQSEVSGVVRTTWISFTTQTKPSVSGARCFVSRCWIVPRSVHQLYGPIRICSVILLVVIQISRKTNITPLVWWAQKVWAQLQIVSWSYPQFAIRN